MRRTARWLPTLLVLLAMPACEEASESSPAGEEASTRTNEAWAQPTPDQANPAPEPAPVTLPEGVDVRVLRITDGDTIHIEYEGRDERLRYIGVNTPETAHSPRGAEPLGDEATEFNRSLVEGQTVRLVLGRDPRDRYGRLLGYVYLRDGTFVNAALIDSGYARVMTVRPNDRFEPHFRTLERNARNAGRGVWSR